jgi:hypothetical protein
MHRLLGSIMPVLENLTGRLWMCAAEESKYPAGRIIQCFMYLRAGSVHDNHYAHPLDLVVFLDMNTGRVLETIMHPNPPFIPELNTNYLAPMVQKERGFRTGAFSFYLPASHHEDCFLVPGCDCCLCLAAVFPATVSSVGSVTFWWRRNRHNVLM